MTAWTNELTDIIELEKHKNSLRENYLTPKDMLAVAPIDTSCLPDPLNVQTLFHLLEQLESLHTEIYYNVDHMQFFFTGSIGRDDNVEADHSTEEFSIQRIIWKLRRMRRVAEDTLKRLHICNEKLDTK